MTELVVGSLTRNDAGTTDTVVRMNVELKR